jgi:glycosyltransferase involved in cell wall biosynthesis
MDLPMDKIFIVLATHQGAAYLRPQVQSIRRQSLADWTLLVRDDGSTDSTAEILQELAGRDDRIRMLPGDGRRYGAVGNFALLIQRAFDLGADYLFLADQDDVWQTDKLRRQMELMRQGEMASGKRIAHLVYSDLVVVNERMQTVHGSFFKCSRLRQGGQQPLGTLLGRSFALGCTCGMNRPLVELVLPLPASIASHDWWAALCAAATGRISCLTQPTLWYRRHGGNSSGPVRFWAGFNPWRHSWPKRWQTGYRCFRRSLDQAIMLRSRLNERGATVAEETQLCLDQFCALFERPQPAWRRIGQLIRLGIPAIDLPRRFLYYLCVSALPGQQTISPPTEPAKTKAA